MSGWVGGGGVYSVEIVSWMVSEVQWEKGSCLFVHGEGGGWGGLSPLGKEGLSIPCVLPPTEMKPISLCLLRASSQDDQFRLQV